MAIHSPSFSKKPSFKKTPLESSITELALGIKAHKNDEFYASGTAIIIGKHLALTANHVIDDFFKKFDCDKLAVDQNGNKSGTFHLQLFQVLNNGQSGLIWNVTRLWTCNFTDLAVLRLSPTSKNALNYKWNIPSLSLMPPNVGDRISAFGYSNAKIIKNDNKIEWFVNAKTAIGEVKEVHKTKRDACRLPFPCYRTNTRFDGAMSGGPVFNDEGCLCGIICSNMPTTDKSSEHISYVTSLWPLMGLKIDINREGHPQDVKYPMLELARDKIISAKGWEKITLNYDDKGNIIQVGLKEMKKRVMH